MIKLDIETFDDAIDYTIELIGADYEKAIKLANSILEDPNSFMTGPAAAITAIKLAIYRQKIGSAAQYWKIKSSNTKKLDDRLVKDSLIVMFTSLEEVINTLKIVARHDHEMVRNG